MRIRVQCKCLDNGSRVCRHLSLASNGASSAKKHTYVRTDVRTAGSAKSRWACSNTLISADRRPLHCSAPSSLFGPSPSPPLWLCCWGRSLHTGSPSPWPPAHQPTNPQSPTRLCIHHVASITIVSSASTIASQSEGAAPSSMFGSHVISSRHYVQKEKLKFQTVWLVSSPCQYSYSK